jgi:hypothetical protein
VKDFSTVFHRLLLCTLALFLFAGIANGAVPRAAPFASRVVLVPIDDRPAVTQFTEWIGRIGDVDVVMPPRELLGTFATGGQPEKIAEWLRTVDYKKVDAVILSIDMLAYGGLMTSRTPATQLEVAKQRLQVIQEIRGRNPNLPIYAFNAIQRVALSATAANRSYRDKLARWVVLSHQSEVSDDPKLKQEFDKVKGAVPETVISDYLASRARNLQINFLMLDLTRSGAVNELLLLQDDAQPYGLHRRDQSLLRKRIADLRLSDAQAKLYNGADEGSSVLLSRAVLRKYNFVPQVRVVYSSDAGRKAVGGFEDQTIETSVERQISGSGGRITTDSKSADYTLYVNAPRQTDSDFKAFSAFLVAELKAGRPVAVADVLMPNNTGGSDPRLIEALGREGLMDRLIGYASWNTAGNTLGTVVPQSNMYILSRRKFGSDRARAERIQRAHIGFLLHRYIGDYGYHSLVRPGVNKQARTEMKIEVDDLERPVYETINATVAERMKGVAREIFDKHFKGHVYSVGRGSREELRLEELENVRVFLPWTRTFEVWVDFDLKFQRSTRAGR